MSCVSVRDTTRPLAHELTTEADTASRTNQENRFVVNKATVPLEYTVVSRSMPTDVLDSWTHRKLRIYKVYIRSRGRGNSMDSELTINSYTKAVPQLRIKHPRWRDDVVIQFEDSESDARRKEAIRAIFQKFYKGEIKNARRVFPSAGYGDAEPTRINRIPLRIAKSSTAALATYLYAGGVSIENIANDLELERPTVEQYISDFLHDRR